MQATTQIDKLRAELKDSKITDREGFLKLYQEYLKSIQKTDSSFQEFSFFCLSLGMVFSSADSKSFIFFL